MAKKRYLVEQYDDEKDEPIKAKEQAGEGGIQPKDEDPTATKKAEEPSTQSGQSQVIPDVKLDQAKALTEEVGDSSEVLNELVAMVRDLSAKVDGLIANRDQASTEQMDNGEEDPQKIAEQAVGFEGDTPSGPSLGSKTDVAGGLPKQAVDPQATAKADNPSEQSGQDMVIPKEPLDKVKQLNERMSGRRVLAGTMSGTRFTEAQDIVTVMKEYAKGVRA